MLWDSALPIIPEAFPYETDAFHRCWWEHLAPKFRIVKAQGDVVLHRKPYLKGLIFLNEVRFAGWNNAWSQDMTENRLHDFANLSAEEPWDCFRMVWDADREQHQSFDRLQELGLPIIQIPLLPAYAIDLSHGWEAYLKTLSRSNRKDVRRKFSRAAALEPKLCFYEGVDGVEAFFCEFFRLHIPYWNAKDGHSYFSDERERAFVVAWAKELMKSGNLILDAVCIGDERVNFSMNIRYGEIRYALLTINSGEYQEYAPGILGLHLRLQHAADCGIRTFHLGAGDYPYKIQFATRLCNRSMLLIPNPRSLKGRLYALWLRHQLKQAGDAAETTSGRAFSAG